MAAQPQRVVRDGCEFVETSGTLSGFGPAGLLNSAVDYGRETLQVVLLWGADTWLADPVGLAAATQAMGKLRAKPGLSGGGCCSRPCMSRSTP